MHRVSSDFRGGTCVSQTQVTHLGMRGGGGELGFSEAAAEDEVKLSMMC